MINSILGYLFLFVGFLILALPLILVELSRPRDWLIGGLFLFLGLFLFVESDLLRGSINLLLISIAILFGKMLFEIFQIRFYQLSAQEKKRMASYERWLESFKQIGQLFALIGNGFFNSLKSFGDQSDKPLKEKKWVHPELKEDIKKQMIEKSDSTSSNKIRNQKLNENEETS